MANAKQIPVSDNGQSTTQIMGLYRPDGNVRVTITSMLDVAVGVGHEVIVPSDDFHSILQIGSDVAAEIVQRGAKPDAANARNATLLALLNRHGLSEPAQFMKGQRGFEFLVAAAQAHMEQSFTLLAQTIMGAISLYEDEKEEMVCTGSN